MAKPPKKPSGAAAGCLASAAQRVCCGRCPRSQARPAGPSSRAGPAAASAEDAGHYLGGTSDVQGADLSKVTHMAVRRDLTPSSAKLVLVMVGLPARGKSFISMRIQTFLTWLGLETKIFNVGQHRRKNETADQDADYFDPSNASSQNARDALAMEVLDTLLGWLDSRQQGAAIFDATNSTVERRRLVRDHVLRHNPAYAVIFVESLCDDPEVLEANVRMKLSKSPDYAGVPYEEAKADFMARIRNYSDAYEPLDNAGEREVDLSYIKLVNLSSHLVAHRVYGSVTMSLLPYLMALHISPRPVWLVRMAHSRTTMASWRTHSNGHWPPPSTLTFGDQAMSRKGAEYAARLAAFAKRHEEMRSARAFACSHRRALDMAELLDAAGERTFVRSFLNPMDWGAYDGIRRKDFEANTSSEFYESFRRDPVNTRFPGGESYADFVRRLMTVLVEVEQQLEPVVVIAPLTSLQVLNCYFERRPVSEASEVQIPQHTVVEWRPDGGNFVRRVFSEAELC